MNCIPNFFLEYTSRFIAPIYVTSPSENSIVIRGTFSSTDSNTDFRNKQGIIQIGKYGTTSNKRRIIALAKYGSPGGIERHEATSRQGIEDFDIAFRDFKDCLFILTPTLG